MPRTHPRRREAQTRRPSRKACISAFEVREGVRKPRLTSDPRDSAFSGFPSQHVFLAVSNSWVVNLVWSRVRCPSFAAHRGLEQVRPRVPSTASCVASQPLAAKPARARDVRGASTRARLSTRSRATGSRVVSEEARAGAGGARRRARAFGGGCHVARAGGEDGRILRCRRVAVEAVDRGALKPSRSRRRARSGRAPPDRDAAEDRASPVAVSPGDLADLVEGTADGVRTWTP